MRKIALVNQKGGCGKTTTAVNLASFLADMGRKVLLVDMDPQGHCALNLGTRPESVVKSTHEVLTAALPVAEAVTPVHENLDAVFSNVVLSAFEQLMSGVHDREYRFKEALSQVEFLYDYILVDCPPSVGLLTFNALMACDEALVPVDSSANSLHGLDRLIDSMAFIRNHVGHAIRVRILPANIAPRTRFGQWMIRTLREKYPDACATSVITSSTRLREAAAHGQPISRFSPQDHAYTEYQALALELLRMEVHPVRVRKAEQLEQKVSQGASRHPEGAKQVVFALEAPEGVPVKVAGDFNNWKPEDLVPARSGDRTVWKKVMTLPPGTYQYKYVVDGRWIPDPVNSRVSEDIYGGYNSIMSV